MMLSNLRLEQIAMYGAQYNTPEAREMARELLALRKEREAAVPDYYVVITSVGVWQAKYKTLAEAQAHIKPWDKGYSIKALYTRLPAQPVVVPDFDTLRLRFEASERESDNGFNLHKYGIGYADEATQTRWETWIACRAAMLNQAPVKQPASNEASHERI